LEEKGHFCNAKFAPISLSFIANWLRSSFEKPAIFEKSKLFSNNIQSEWKKIEEEFLL
jgi:hypothetical protein